MAQYINETLFPGGSSAYSGSPKETAKQPIFPSSTAIPRDPPGPIWYGRTKIARARQRLPRRLVWQPGHPADAVWFPSSAPNAQPEMTSNNNSTLVNEVI